MSGNSWSQRAFRSLLLCYPEEFRYEYGREMALDFQNRFRKARGRRGLIRLWLEILADTAITAPKEHIDMLLQDVRYGLRMLGQNPAFTAIAILTLALGIGANTAIFSLLDAMVLHPLPYADTERLVQIWEGDRQQGPQDLESNAPDFLDWRQQSRSFEQIAGYRQTSFTLTGVGEPAQIDGARVTANFLETLGVRPILGRGFTQSEDRSGGDPVALLSNALWRNSFGSDGAIVGKTVALNGLNHVVIGVLPETFSFRHLGPAGFWVPMDFTEQELRDRRSHWLYVIGKLRQNVSLREAQSEMDGIGARLKQAHPDTNVNSGIAVITLREQVSRMFRGFWIVFAAVGFVLLIACANIANLLLARSSARQREIGIRMVIGANRARILRQLVTESALLFVFGGLAGLFAAAWGIRLLSGLVPVEMRGYLPRAGVIEINSLVLWFTLGVSLLTGLIFGLMPAWSSTRHDLGETTREGGIRSSGGRRGRVLRGAMVISEIALALVLLIGAGLLAKTFIRLQTMNHGFQVDHVLTASVRLPAARYSNGVAVNQFYDQVLNRTSGMHNATAAGLIDFLPLLGANMTDGFLVEGRPVPPAAEIPGARVRAASAGYFGAMRIPLVRGRLFAETDTFGAGSVVLVSQRFVDRNFKGEDPIGRRIQIVSDNNHWREIIGVVGDVKHDATDRTFSSFIYFPYTQRRVRDMHIVLRTSGDPASAAGDVRGLVASIDKSLPISEVFTMNQVMGINLIGQRISSSLVSGFALLAMLLAAVGIYGVMSYAVSVRTQEMGIRMALGASRKQVAGLILRQSLVLVAGGLAIGVAASVGLTSLMKSVLFGVSPTDPVVYGIVVGLLILVAVLAALIPARRATIVDPMVALKYE